MKRLRLFGLSLLLLSFALLTQAPPAYAICTGLCTSDKWCQNCTGIPYSFCINGHCAA